MSVSSAALGIKKKTADQMIWIFIPNVSNDKQDFFVVVVVQI